MVDDTDRQHYLCCVARAVALTDWRIISYALMSSHIHLGLIAGRRPLSTLLHRTHTSFASYWHRRYGGLGPVFADRPRNWLVAPHRVARLVAYHHLNPVTAGVVTLPIHSRWTSHRAYMMNTARPRWLDAREGLVLCGFEDTVEGRHQFDECVREAELEREATSPVNLTDTFVCDWNVAPGCIGNEPHTSLASLASTIANRFNVPQSCVLKRTRPSHAARLEFVFSASQLGYSSSRIAAYLGISQSAYSRLLQRANLNPDVKS